MACIVNLQGGAGMWRFPGPLATAFLVVLEFKENVLRHVDVEKGVAKPWAKMQPPARSCECDRTGTQLCPFV